MTNKVITISRQFGSGGRTIGKAVAERLGIPYYDKELVDAVAKESGFSHEFIEEIGEYATVTSSFLFNIAVSSHPMGLIDTMSVSDKLYVCQTNVIRDLADKGPCVIVGRCADFILKDRPTACMSSSHATTRIALRVFASATARRSSRWKSAYRKRTASARSIISTIRTATGARPGITTSASTAVRSAWTSASTLSATSRKWRDKSRAGAETLKASCAGIPRAGGFLTRRGTKRFSRHV